MKIRPISRFFLFITALLLSYNAFAFDSGTVRMADLPKEAQQTIMSIQQGGPFPYEKDGSVFGNYEKVLPQQKRGYYREFTVKTPRARNREQGELLPVLNRRANIITPPITIKVFTVS